jgi:DNA-binding phage protein
MDPLHGGQFPLEGGQIDAHTTDPLNAASAAAVQNLLNQVARNSAFSRVAAPIPSPSYSDMMAQALQAQAQPHLVQLLAQANGLNYLNMQPQHMHMPPVEPLPLPSDRGRQTRSGGDGRTNTNNSYASRHQQVSF